MEKGVFQQMALYELETNMQSINQSIEHYTFQKIKSIWMIGPNVNGKTIRYLEENIQKIKATLSLGMSV